MRRLPVDRADLAASIGAAWTKKAIGKRQKRTIGSGWTEVLPVFLALQDKRCAFCETSGDFFDVEHFRPKGSCKAWDEDPTLPHGRSSGYPELAHAWWNYVAACTACNSRLKSNMFPIAGKASSKTKGWKATKPDADWEAIRGLNATEKPLLLYPLGAIDIDPASVIEWDGPLPRAKKGARGVKRGRTTIHFFRLDGDLSSARKQRLQLVKDRATAILLAAAQPALATDVLPFPSAVAAFRALQSTNPGRAAVIIEACRRLLPMDAPILRQLFTPPV